MKKAMNIKSGLMIIPLVMLMVVGVAETFLPTASADTIDPNRIIVDSTFEDTTSMSISSINTFLNSFSSSCLSSNNGFSTPDPQGYSTQTNQYTFGSNVTGGQALYDIAQHYHVNPQVLLTTLQKEQSVVSGSQGCYANVPNPSQAFPCDLYNDGTTYSCTPACTYSGGCMNIAMSYGCPGNCNAAQEGFSTQISAATWMLRFAEERAYGILSGYTGYDSGDQNYTYNGPMTAGYRQRVANGPTIYYDGTTTIANGSGGTVTVDNGSTASLYSYTPFLSGNENFFNIYSSWFGSPVNHVDPVPNAVWRLYNQTTGDHVLTGSATEANAFIDDGWQNDGIVTYSDPNSGGTPVYRLWNSANQTHFITASTTELNAYVAAGWHNDGVIFNSLDLIPAHRMDETTGNTHVLTTNISSEEQYIAEGWSDAGIQFYVSTDYGTPVYQLYYPSNQDYFYTTSTNERDTYINAGWSNQGIVFYAPTGGDTAVHRLYDASSNTHMIVPSGAALTTDLSNGWSDDGVIFYAWSTASP